MAPDAIVNNSPALESLKHAQLRSLCSRHSVNSTGKVRLGSNYYGWRCLHGEARQADERLVGWLLRLQKDVLISRLKALREGHAAATETERLSEEPAPPSSSESAFDIIDKEELQGNSEEQEQPRPSTSTARIQTDEFGALSAGTTRLLQHCT